MSESYEAQRLQNIRYDSSLFDPLCSHKGQLTSNFGSDNEALLLSLGLATPAKLISGASQRKPKLTAIRERCREDGPFSPVYKLSSPKTGSRNRLAEDGSFSPGVRRSSRQSAWKCDHIDNADLTSKSSPKRKRVEVASLQESEREEEDVVETDQTRLRNAKKMGVRTQNP